MSKIVTLCQSETGGTLALMRGRCAVNMSSVVLLTPETFQCFPCPFVLWEDGSTRWSTAILDCWAKGGDGLRDLGGTHLLNKTGKNFRSISFSLLPAKQEALTSGSLEQMDRL